MKYGIFLGICVLLVASISFSEELPKTKKGKDGAEMVLIPKGSFSMGTDDGDLVEAHPKHEVHVDGFYMDRYEVTNKQFAEFLNAMKPSEGVNSTRWNWVVLRSDLDFDERSDWWPTEIMYEEEKYEAFNGYEKFPVITVNWEAADFYCRWAGKRLPTEAEWEYASRGGLKEKRFPWGDEIPTGGLIFSRAWRSNLDPPPTSSVGNYHPNGYGLYDMAGNVWEWCSDWFSPFYYKDSPKENPKGPDSGMEKVIRGGSWFNNEMVLRVALRNWNDPKANDDATGFRCVEDIESK